MSAVAAAEIRHWDKSPLRPTEAIALGRLVRQGDPGARSRLIASCVPLVYKIVNRYARIAPYLYEDLVSAGMIALTESLNYYKPEKGFAFTTFASRYVMWKVRNTMVAERFAVTTPERFRTTKFRVGPLLMTNDEGDTVDQDIPVHPELRDSIEIRTLNQAMTALSDRQRLVLRRRYEQEKTLADVGTELGISRERVRQIEVRAIKRLRKRMRRQ